MAGWGPQGDSEKGHEPNETELTGEILASGYPQGGCLVGPVSLRFSAAVLGSPDLGTKKAKIFQLVWTVHETIAAFCSFLCPSFK